MGKNISILLSIHLSKIGSIWFNKINFENQFLLNSSEISGPVILMDSTIFNNYVDFYGTNFQNWFNITNVIFKEIVNFHKISSDNIFSIEDSYYNKDVSFRLAKFNNQSSIINTHFNKSVEFLGVNFKESPRLIGVQFNDTLDFRMSNFEQGLDIRRVNTDSVNVLFIEDMKYPIGSFYYHWDQLKGEEYPRIQLKNLSSDQFDNYHRLEKIYEGLKDNFLAQGNRTSADVVMYELALYKDILIPNLWYDLYGIFMGYGYKPYKYILFLIIPLIMIFAFVWYYFYYGIIVRIINKNIDRELGLVDDYKIQFNTEEKILLKKLKYKIYDHKTSKPKISKFAKIWQMLYFSASVLLGIRFKKEWIIVSNSNNLGYKSYFYILTFEWLLGFGLYIVFAVFVKGSYFSIIKGLFGF